MSVARAIATATVVTIFLIHHASASTYPLNASSLNSGAFYVTEGPMYGGEGAECSTRLELASGSGSVWLGFVQNNTKNVALLLDVHKACSGDWITIAEKDTAFKNYILPGTSLRNPNVVEIKWLGPSADVAVYAVVAKCDGSDITLGKGSNISFKGARGYLPGRLWSFLPFWGVLYANYCLLLLLYLVLYCKNRAHVLDVQRYIVVVMIAGLVETGAWFFSYNAMNGNGAPSCCPIHGGLKFAIVANAIKETVSRVLILAVYLGWGVVRPRLERKTTYAVAALAVAFFGSSLWNQLRDIASTEALGLAGQQAAAPAVTFDAIMVAFLNSVFILWIYSGGLKVMRELKNTSQTEKLNMYRRLTKRLFICITAFILFSFAALIVTRVSDSGSFGWQLLFLIDRSSIWSVLFLAVLVAIAAIWRPSETTARYSYSHQIGQVDDDDDGGEEMAHEIGEVDIIPGDSDDDAGNNNVVDAGQVELEMVAPLEKRSPKGESDDDKTGVNPGDIVEM